MFKIGENTFVNAVMNIPDKGKQRMFSFGQAIVFKGIFFLSEAVKLLSSFHLLITCCTSSPNKTVLI
jgi:hypothetical protein